MPHGRGRFGRACRVTWIDFAIIALVLLSTLISLVRGIVKEVLSLASWAVAFGVAVYYANRLAAMFAGFIHVGWLRYVVGFLLILVATLLLASLLSRLIGVVVKTSGLGVTDRLLGMAFGFARGLVIVGMLTVMMSVMPVTDEAWWKGSALLPWFRGATQWLTDHAPKADMKDLIGRLGDD